MKLLIVCQYYYPENFVIYKLAENLASLGHDVHVLTGKPNYGYGYILPKYKNVREEIINDVKVHRVNIYPRKKSRLSIIRNYLSFWLNSKKWVRKTKEDFDIVYSMSLSPVTILSAGNLYCNTHHKKHIVHCVDLWPESVLTTKAVKKSSITYKILYKWSKKLYQNSSKILISSPSFKDYFNDILSINKELIYLPQPSLVEDNEKIIPFNYDSNYFNFVYCGNLGIIQNIELIAEAMKNIKEKPIRMHVIGMGPKLETLNQMIEQYKLENVICHGPMPSNLSVSYIKGADALYVSLKDDGYVANTIPNKLMMYMAFGKPILAMLNGDGRCILEKTNGAIFSEQNSNSLAENIVKTAALSNDEKETMGLNNKRYYYNNFSIDKISIKLEQILLNEII